MTVEVVVETTQIRALADRLDGINRDMKPAIRRAINRTGDQTTTLVKRVVAKQMGLRVGTARDQLQVKRANNDQLRYTITGRGGYIPLKEFRARQTKKGVSAAPWNVRRIFPGTFFVASLGGNVFSRTSDERGPLHKMWGPALPKELVRGESRKAFETTVATVFPRRLEHEVARLLGT